MVDLVLDDACLQSLGLDHHLLAMRVTRTYAHLCGSLDLDVHAGRLRQPSSAISSSRLPTQSPG